LAKPETVAHQVPLVAKVIVNVDAPPLDGVIVQIAFGLGPGPSFGSKVPQAVKEVGTVLFVAATEMSIGRKLPVENVGH
jgi:hypothetical protein